MRTLILFLASLGLSLPAMAVDGVLEINQACVSVGCFPGDLAGFPVTISSTGSYRLTSSLDVTGEGSPQSVSAISVTAGDATLDLNGFSILGPVTCSGGSPTSPVTSCAPSGGSGNGIGTSPNTQVVIRNGQIRGMGARGIFCFGRCRIEDVVLSHNGLLGISTQNVETLILRSVADSNGGDGFFVAGLVKDSTATRNLGRGIYTNPFSQVIGNQSLHNGSDGVRCFNCLLLDNVIASNGGFGVDFGMNASYGRNLIMDNSSGEIDGTAFQVDANRCGASSC